MDQAAFLIKFPRKYNNDNNNDNNNETQWSNSGHFL